MVKFLIHRPIAVTMTFIAILVLGLVSSQWLPVSLMPDVDIPKITVHISSENTPARELENTSVRIFRRQLMQVEHLADITSETRDGSAVITLQFNYGTDIDLAFIEVNEKIDRAMSGLPNSIERPRVVKASATDIPVFYLNLTLNTNQYSPTPPTTELPPNNQLNNQPNNQPNTFLSPVSQQFINLSTFASQVISKRIEQLPEVAIADISGQVYPELLILPDIQKMQSMGISIEDLENTIRQNNVDLGNLLIRDGQYQYNVRFENTLIDKRDIENIYIKKETRLLQIKDLATIVEHPQQLKGMVTADGKNAITMAIIKQSDARMKDLRDNLYSLVDHFRSDYPDVQFTVNRDQTRLLDVSIRNLKQSLLIGALLAFIIMFLFLKDVRSPLLIGLTIPTSLIITLLFFFLGHLSLNIVSLSGLILGVGMMVDNSIIVIDNITQFRERGHSLDDACVYGTNEVFRPMLSSVLTTCAVFIPLIFLGGITGALFYDQAMAITIGLLVSLAVSITLLPVYYRIAYRRGKAGRQIHWLEKINRLDYGILYEKGFRFVMRHQGRVWISILIMLVLSVWLYRDLRKEKMPPLTRNEILLSIDWNDRINLEENNTRVNQMLRSIDSLATQNTCMIGEQQFMMDHQSNASGTQSAVIYLKTKNEKNLDLAMNRVSVFLKDRYPDAIYEYRDAGNIFELLFEEKQAPLQVRLRATKDFGPAYNARLKETVDELSEAFPDTDIPPVAGQEQIILRADPALLTLYEVDQNRVLQALRSSFNKNQVLLITSSQTFIPVIMGERPKTLQQILNTTTVLNKEKKEIRLASLFSVENDRDLKTIVAGQEGEYYPIPLQVPDNRVVSLTGKVKKLLLKRGWFEAGFTGSYFSNRAMIRDLLMILVISLLLLYFILASQFESLVLPVIVLLEVPIDIFGALLLLKIFGSSINLMSLIGIVVMSGVIINDSILKIDTINQLNRQGMSLMKSLVVAGQRRLKPILMTSLTTILALLPFLFMKGLGSDLQKPLALAIIGGMVLGTVVSLYFVPLCYYYLKKVGR